jgi:hypothetical protein
MENHVILCHVLSTVRVITKRPGSVTLYREVLSYFELHVVLNIQGGILAVALNIVTFLVVNVLDGNTILVSMKVKGIYCTSKRV